MLAAESQVWSADGNTTYHLKRLQKAEISHETKPGQQKVCIWNLLRCLKQHEQHLQYMHHFFNKSCLPRGFHIFTTSIGSKPTTICQELIESLTNCANTVLGKLPGISCLLFEYFSPQCTER